MKIIFSDECLKYTQAGHPENPERVEQACDFLKNKGCEFIKPEVASEKDILRVHSKELFEVVKNEDFFSTGDNPTYENIFYYASLSAGAAIEAMEECDKEVMFSLMRPPGHHACRGSFGGFCYFNNIAIAVAKYLDENKNKKVAILDIDVHHGNGTQDIFLGNEKVLYVSLHQYPHYPGTGKESEKNCFNYPLSAGIEEKKYIKTFKKALIKVKKFSPNLIAVSAGFDTFKEDPLSRFKLEIESYKKIAKLIKNLGKPTFSVLEGGYSGALGECIHSYLKGFE